MEWTRSETIALAKNDCASCHGVGLRLTRNGKSNPCHCVLRAIFRICFNRFRHCVQKEKYMTQVSLECVPGVNTRMTWSRKDEEYVADFILVSKRTLTPEEYRLFRAHFLLGADWRLCTRQLGMDRGNFFHAVYRIQSKLGLVFRELKPYALFPVQDYFNTTRTAETVVNPAYAPRKVMPIRPRVRVPNASINLLKTA